MGRVKITNESLTAARKHASGIKERMARKDLFLSLFNPEFWQLIEEDMNERIETLTAHRDSKLSAMTEADLKANLSEERAYRHIKTLPARVQKVRDDLMREFAAVSSSIRDRAKEVKE